MFTAGSQPFIHHMNVYECVGDPSVFEVLAATEGSRCYQPSMPPLFFNCNNVVVAWTASSEVKRREREKRKNIGAINDVSMDYSMARAIKFAVVAHQQFTKGRSHQIRPARLEAFSLFFCQSIESKGISFVSFFAGVHIPIRGGLPNEPGWWGQVLHAGDALRQSEPAERHRRSLGAPPLLHFTTQVCSVRPSVLHSNPFLIIHSCWAARHTRPRRRKKIPRNATRTAP